MFVALAGCSREEPSPAAKEDTQIQPQVVDRTNAEDDIREAVFRHQLKHEGRSREVCFLGIDRKDPSPVFLRRFGATPTVKPVSASKTAKKWSEKDVPHPVVDKSTRKAGVILNCGRIRWIDERTVEVAGDCTLGAQGSEGFSYRVERKGERWTVTNREHLFSD
jgi:hypothetical protein